MVDLAKEAAIKAELESQGVSTVAFVPVQRFLDGNDDPGSIGCNLDEHPGMDVFRATLLGIAQRPDVEAVYAVIAEVDPGIGCWPFADTVLVFGSVATGELAALLQTLSPDEVVVADDGMVPARLRIAHPGPVHSVWWD